MPPLTAELAGVAATVVGLLVIAITVDPRLITRRARNRHARMVRHAAQGCQPCTVKLEGIALRKTVEANLTALGYSRRPAGGKQARR